MAEVMKADKRLTLLLGDIGVFGFRQVFADYPERIYKVGILEQATVSLAAGLAMEGFVPVVHTIAPFLVERSYEQLKVDFGYQGLGGNFVSVGASYDYAALGCTHHCPADVGVLKNIPNMSIVVPGTAKEFDLLFKQAYAEPHPTYYRLSESGNPTDHDVLLGKAKVIQRGTKAVVLAFGPMLGPVSDAVKDLDVTLLYYTTVKPFDAETLREVTRGGSKVIVCEPYYMGTVSFDVSQALKGLTYAVDFVGVPHEFLYDYGTKEEHDIQLGLTAKDIKSKVLGFIA